MRAPEITRSVISRPVKRANIVPEITTPSGNFNNAFLCCKPVPKNAFLIDVKARLWDYPTVIVSIDSKRRLTVPMALAPTTPGDYFDAQFDPEEDSIVFRRLAAKSDWLAVMKECPLPIDDLPARRREFPRRRKL